MKLYKKLTILIMIMMISAIIIVGCDKSTDEIQPDTSTEETVDNPTDNLGEVKEEDNELKTENNDLRHLGIVYEGKKIVIMDILDDQDIENILGEADEIKSHTYSKDDGLNMDQLEGFTEKQYYYPGLVIKTIDATSDNQAFVFSIDVTNEKYETTKNIKIGDSYEKLKEAYTEGNLLSGGELSDEEDDYRYEPIDYSSAINFHIKNKKVDSIIMFQLLD